MDDVTKRERTLSGALALAMHALFLILLVVGVSWQPKRSAAPIAVELWSELPPPARPAPPPPPEPVTQAPRPEPRPEPKPEFKPVPDPQIAIKEQLAKKKLLEEKARLERERKEREQKLAKEKAEREKLERDRKIKEELEAKKRKDKELAEQKRREEEKKRLAEKQRQEELTKIAKEKEEALRKLLAQQAAEAEARGRLDAYSRMVGDRIKRYIVLPPNIQGNPEAQFEVVQIPGGEILSVRLKRSSGNPAYDAAVERAIHKAQPLPPPPDPARFSEVRELELRFRPKE